MRLVTFNAFSIGVLTRDGVVDVSAVLPARWRGTPLAMNQLIEDFEQLRVRIENLATTGAPAPVSGVRLLPPVPAPTHLFAAPLNYKRHVGEMENSTIVHSGWETGTAADLGFFLKAPGSIVGSADAIELPNLPGRVFHHEPELAAVIGREAKALLPGKGLAAVFGYTCLLDITLRNSPADKQERVMRKSFATFSPIGPVLVTADEIADPGSLGVRLWVNDQLRQEANTRDLIVPVGELVERASQVLPLRPGDVYATGTPEGVGPIEPGDRVRMSIDSIGSLELDVRRRTW
jgi:2-keto-4-pentenoate hydratase/2-oxohepta-3-ene-1,7-dioic acid hydratase in catechol pathway